VNISDRGLPTQISFLPRRTWAKPRRVRVAVWAAPRPKGHASRRATRIAPPPRSEPLSRIVLLHLQSPERLEISVMQIYLIRTNPNRRQHTQWSIYICKEERSMQGRKTAGLIRRSKTQRAAAAWRGDQKIKIRPRAAADRQAAGGVERVRAYNVHGPQPQP
jgi:hypothetical protein